MLCVDMNFEIIFQVIRVQPTVSLAEERETACIINKFKACMNNNQSRPKKSKRKKTNNKNVNKRSK